MPQPTTVFTVMETTIDIQYATDETIAKFKAMVARDLGFESADAVGFGPPVLFPGGVPGDNEAVTRLPTRAKLQVFDKTAASNNKPCGDQDDPSGSKEAHKYRIFKQETTANNKAQYNVHVTPANPTRRIDAMIEQCASTVGVQLNTITVPGVDIRVSEDGTFTMGGAV
ncbi:hypothetical protein MFIFM68171_08109 [Madurella fahalii]|uniref:Uncharacterized protein n=1 Tax=Madurella fahalii TaxID=1157608 RepID=A0ABQ0GJG8_9PEZI